MDYMKKNDRHYWKNGRAAFQNWFLLQLRNSGPIYDFKALIEINRLCLELEHYLTSLKYEKILAHFLYKRRIHREIIKDLKLKSENSNQRNFQDQRRLNRYI